MYRGKVSRKISNFLINLSHTSYNLTYHQCKFAKNIVDDRIDKIY